LKRTTADHSQTPSQGEEYVLATGQRSFPLKPSKERMNGDSSSSTPRTLIPKPSIVSLHHPTPRRVSQPATNLTKQLSNAAAKEKDKAKETDPQRRDKATYPTPSRYRRSRPADNGIYWSQTGLNVSPTRLTDSPLARPKLPSQTKKQDSSNQTQQGKAKFGFGRPKHRGKETQTAGQASQPHTKGQQEKLERPQQVLPPARNFVSRIARAVQQPSVSASSTNNTPNLNLKGKSMLRPVAPKMNGYKRIMSQSNGEMNGNAAGEKGKAKVCHIRSDPRWGPGRLTANISRPPADPNPRRNDSRSREATPTAALKFQPPTPLPLPPLRLRPPRDPQTLPCLHSADLPSALHPQPQSHPRALPRPPRPRRPSPSHHPASRLAAGARHPPATDQAGRARVQTQSRVRPAT
jgi:hypothetical protein